MITLNQGHRRWGYCSCNKGLFVHVWTLPVNCKVVYCSQISHLSSVCCLFLVVFCFVYSASILLSALWLWLPVVISFRQKTWNHLFSHRLVEKDGLQSLCFEDWLLGDLTRECPTTQSQQKGKQSLSLLYLITAESSIGYHGSCSSQAGQCHNSCFNFIENRKKEEILF